MRKEAERRKGNTDAVDFATLWKALEYRAGMYKRALDRAGTPSATLTETLTRTESCIAAINVLVEPNTGLLNPELQAWDFISGSGMACKDELPAASARLVRELELVRAELAEDAKTLHKIAAGKEAHAFGPDDHRRLLIKNMQVIGHNLFGPEIGGEDGPLMTFLRLTLQPVLGDATPNRATMRTIARRKL